MQYSARPVRAWIAGLAAASLAASGAVAVATATTASAAETAVSNAQASWGVKASWRNYVANNGTVSVSEGAAFDGGTEASPYTWPSAVVGGTYDEGTRAGTIHLAGKVNFAYPVHFIDLTLSNPTVVVRANGTGDLLADVTYDYTQYNNTSLDADQVKIADLVVPAPTTTLAGATATETFTGITVTLNSTGAAAFANFYPAPTTIDPLTLSFDHPAVTAPTTLPVLTTSPVGSAQVGAPVTLSASVLPAGAEGSVQFFDGATNLGSVATSGGNASVTTSSLGIGQHAFSAQFTPTDTATYNASTSATLAYTVSKASTTTKLALTPSQVEYARNYSARITVTSPAGGPAPTGTVTLRERGVAIGNATLSAGSATIVRSARVSAAKHTLTATFAGNASLLASSSNATLTVAKATTAMKASLAKKRIKKTANGKVFVAVTATGVVPRGTVTVSKGKKILRSKALSTTGKVTFKLPKLKKGKHTLKVRYFGNGSFTGATKKLTLKVTN